MHIIQHRINSSGLLKNIPNSHGVEIDLRSNLAGIYLAHDPFVDGENFEIWLDSWSGQFLVLNVKEEGIEGSIIEILKSRNIVEYFFLDQSFPYIQKLVRGGNTQTATRVSDLESVETALAAGTSWVWLDCFSGNWAYLYDALPTLSRSRKRMCLVSPELQRSDSDLVELQQVQKILSEVKVTIDAVCTKRPEHWEIL